MPHQRGGSVHRLPPVAREDHGYREPAGPGSASTRAWPRERGRPASTTRWSPSCVVHGVDREHARRRMLRALEEYEIEGRDDAGRLPPGAARAPVLRRRGDVPGVVESEQLARASRAVVASDNKRSGGVGRAAHERAASGGGRRPALRGQGPRARSRRTRSSPAAAATATRSTASTAARDAIVTPDAGHRPRRRRRRRRRGRCRARSSASSRR